MTAVGSDPSWATILARQLPRAGHTAMEHSGHGDFVLPFKLGIQVVRVPRHPDAATALRHEACILMEIVYPLTDEEWSVRRFKSIEEVSG